MSYTVLSLGEVLWDMIPGGAKPGGAPANFAYHAQILGANAAFLSAVGTDKLGDDLVEFFRLIGLSVELVQRIPDFPTGTVGVDLDKDGKPKYTIHENTAWDNIACPSEAIEFAKKCDAVCFGSLASRSEVSRRSIRTILENTRPETLKIFDLNLRAPFYQKDVIDALLRSTNILKLNDEEITILSEMFGVQASDPSEQAAWFLDNYGFSMLILTRGEHGSFLIRKVDGKIETSDHPGIKVPQSEIADTIGAGDAFTAATVIGFMSGWPLDAINTTANKYAAYICTCPGATPNVPEEYSNSILH